MEVNDSNYLQKLFIDEAKPALEWFETRWGGGEVKLPEGYERVEYIENADGTRVPTGVPMSGNDMELSIRVYIPSNFTSEDFNIFRAGSPGDNFTTGIFGSNNYIEAHNEDTRVLRSTLKRKAAHTYDINMSLRDGVMRLYVKDIDTGEEDTKETPYSFDLYSNTSVYIFGTGKSSYMNDECYSSAGHRVYSAKIVKDGKVAMDYIPVTKDGVPGFYDTVTKTFVTQNQGSLIAPTA